MKLSCRDYAKYGIPARFAAETPKELANDNRPSAQVFRNTIAKIIAGETPKRGLLVIGKRGTGKTTWVCEIAKAAVEAKIASDNRNKTLEQYVFDTVKKCTVKNSQITHAKTPRFTTFWDFIADLRKSFATGERYAEELTNAGYIFIDDLGKVQTQRDWFVEAFQEVVDRLYNEEPGQKILYITSNMTSEELSNTFGEACKDRIDALCYTVPLLGKSLRT